MIVFLTKPRHFDELAAILPSAKFCTTLDEVSHGGDVLITYGTGVIVTQSILDRWAHKYNVHGAPPQYPGRDPHVWAAHDRATVYGATAHIMTRRVDDGAIVGTLLHGFTPAEPMAYHAAGERAALALFASLAPLMAIGAAVPSGAVWTGQKRSRSDAHAMADRGVEAFAAFRRASTPEPRHTQSTATQSIQTATDDRHSPRP